MSLPLGAQGLVATVVPLPLPEDCSYHFETPRPRLLGLSTSLRLKIYDWYACLFRRTQMRKEMRERFEDQEIELIKGTKSQSLKCCECFHAIRAAKIRAAK